MTVILHLVTEWKVVQFINFFFKDTGRELELSFDVSLEYLAEGVCPLDREGL